MTVRGIAVALTITALAAFGQPTAERSVVRVLPLSGDPTTLTEIATLIRVITDIREVSLDTARKQITIRGTPDQIGGAEWLLSELDTTFGREYRLPDGDENSLRMFHLASATTPQGLTEIATTLRTVADIWKLFVVSAGRAIGVRGTPGQVALADWLVSELDGAAARPTAEQHPAPGIENQVVRVFRLRGTTREMMEVMTALRVTADIRRIFLYTERGALTVRGTPAQLALSDWLITSLQTSLPADAARKEYPMPHDGSDVVRVFYVKNAATERDLWDTAAILTSTAELRKVYACPSQRAVAVRGTANQMAMAEQLLRERDQPRPADVAR